MLGMRPGNHTLGLGGQMPSQMSFWFNEIGIKTVYICPDVNYSVAIHAGKWIRFCLIPTWPSNGRLLCLAYRGSVRQRIY
jgi:hypothetical protein